MPHTASVADYLAIIKTVNTEVINHDPAITYIQTGSQLPGRPSLGAWLSYGLGSSSENLPLFVMLYSSWSDNRDAQALYSRLWGSGFMSSKFQSVSLRTSGDPVLYLSNPPGVSAAARRRMLDTLASLDERQYETTGDPEINTRLAQY